MRFITERILLRNLKSKVLLDTDQKKILLDQNNFVGILKIMSNTAKVLIF